MAFTGAQRRLKDQFVQVHGYWNPTWKPILEAIPEQFAAYVEFSAVPYRSGKLTPKVRELISIAVNVSMTFMNKPAVRVHIENALRLGATREEILEVFGIYTVLGVHSVSHPLPILLKEMERRGQMFEVTFSARAREVQEAWVKKRGYWPSSFDTLNQEETPILLKMFHYTIGETRKIATPSSTNQSLIRSDPALTVQVEPWSCCCLAC